MSLTPREQLEKMYDDFAENYRACCMTSNEIKYVLSQGLTEKQKKHILSAARIGWRKRLHELDIELAKQGEQ